VAFDRRPQIGKGDNWRRLTGRSSRSHDAVIRVYDDAGNVIETHEQVVEFREWSHMELLITSRLVLVLLMRL
jgi:hypothetical protein